MEGLFNVDHDCLLLLQSRECVQGYCLVLNNLSIFCRGETFLNNA